MRNFMNMKTLTAEEANQKTAEIEPLLEEFRDAQERYQQAKDEMEYAFGSLTEALFGEGNALDSDQADYLVDEDDTAETLVESSFDIAKTEDERRELSTYLRKRGEAALAHAEALQKETDDLIAKGMLMDDAIRVD